MPATLAESRKRERHFHKTKAAALAHAANLREKHRQHGEAATAIRPSLAEAATLAEKILAPWKVSLVEAAKLVAAVKEQEDASRPLGIALDAWIPACEGLRPRTVEGYNQTAKRLKDALGERLTSSLSAEDLQRVIAPPGSHGAAVQGRIRNARVFWRWAAKKGWCKAEVFDALEIPKSNRDADEISILTVSEASALLRTAETHYPQAVASYALQLFAGIRSEELVRLEACHVSPEGIELPAAVTKKGRRRHITPSPTLAAWLAAYPFAPCVNWKEVDTASRRLAGWKVTSRLLKDPPEPNRGSWPQNALRHSHASYAVAFGVPLESLLFEFGHAGTPAVLRQHYVGRASKRDAIEYFSLGPKRTKLPIVTAA